MSDVTTLDVLLAQLRLPTIKTCFQSDTLLAEQENWSYTQYLTSLCDKELAARNQRRINRQIKESKLPPGKTLANFKFEDSNVNPAQINALADNPDWVKQANNLILFGPSGVGKTHLAAAIAYRLIEHGVKALYMSSATLVQMLQHAHQAYRLPAEITKLARFPLLVLDDIGYVKKDDAETSVLFELIAERYECQSLIITANQPFGQWDTIFPDSTIATAAVDRLVHHSTIINIEGESYRRTHPDNSTKT